MWEWVWEGKITILEDTFVYADVQNVCMYAVFHLAENGDVGGVVGFDVYGVDLGRSTPIRSIQGRSTQIKSTWGRSTQTRSIQIC